MCSVLSSVQVVNWLRVRNLGLIRGHCKNQCDAGQDDWELETGPAAPLLVPRNHPDKNIMSRRFF